MIKSVIIAASLLLLQFSVFSQNSGNDTINIRVHDKVDMTWYGGYSEWGEFPSGDESFRKIIMKYTMGCASTGCSDWDYTTRILLRHRTGEIDTIPAVHPNFTVDGGTVDSLFYCIDSTFITQFNETTLETDTVWQNPLQIVFYELENNNVTAFDTLDLYLAGYWNYYYDDTQDIIDSVFIMPCDTLVMEEIDYENHIPVIDNYELARKITPYGGYMANGNFGFSNNWAFTSYFDVTDFAPLLKDSVEIIAFYDGWSSGFSVTLDFEFIKGTPPRDVINIQNLWSGKFSYNNAEDFNNVLLEPKSIIISEDEKYARLRVTPSGHGFDNNLYCAEFCPKSYYIFVNNDQKYEQLMWDDKCGLNPIYPQGGTWLYDRANWCPGLRAETFLHEITDFYSPGDMVELNMDVESYSWTGNQTPYYYIEAQLVTYSDANFDNDAELYDIIAPSSKDEFSRINPICNFPKVVIRNSGKNQLTSLDINYGLVDGTLNTYQWSGNLAFMETDTVVLGYIDWTDGTPHRFKAEVSNPNGVEDEYPDNNTMYSDVIIPDVINHDKIIIYLRTNSQGWQNAYYIKDAGGNVIFERDSLDNNTLYRDTVELEVGHCYTFKVIDRAQNGLSFWANNEGSGQVSLRNAENGVIIKNFITDFGTELNYKFTTHYPLKSDFVYPDKIDIDIFPNPCNDKINISFKSNFSISNYLNIDIYSMQGKKVFDKKISDMFINNIKIDVSGINSGLYFIKIYNSDLIFIDKFIKM